MRSRAIVSSRAWSRGYDSPERATPCRWQPETTIMPPLDYLVIAPYPDDAHPDHVAASRLVDDARFWAKLTKTDLPGEPHYPQRILYYFSVHLRLHPKPSFVLDVTAHHDTKMKAISCYHSQFIE